MTTTTHTPSLRGVMPRAIGLAVAIVTGAALLLGLLAGALGTSSANAPAAPAAPTVTAAAPGPIGPTAMPLPATPAPALAPAATYTVVAGDTLAGVAQRAGVPVELLAADNGLGDPNRVAAGQVLEVPTPPSNVVVIGSGATLSDYAQQYATTVDRLLDLNPQITDADRILAGAGLRIAS